MSRIGEYIAKMLAGAADPGDYGVYGSSVRSKDGVTVFMARGQDGADELYAFGDAHPFAGEARSENGVEYTACALNHGNAAALRAMFPFCAPQPVLSANRCTFGLGDRLGRATGGHLQAIKAYDVVPVLAQQSMRELTLTGRSYASMLDDVTFFVFREGYEGGYGADGDHLKKMEDIGSALEDGYTMITLDLSEHIHPLGAEVPEAGEELKARYLGRTFSLAGGGELSFSEEDLNAVSAIYTEAMDFTAQVYRTYLADGKYPAELEVSIDETPVSTTPIQHFFVANELTVRGVKFATIAPRFFGEFQKGIDYRGDLQVFTEELKVHQAIADTFGYKLSVHSGSDKFSVFPIIGEITGGRFHIKISGTSWLEAMRLAALKAPQLYRDIHKYALTVFEQARTYYHVSADPARVPDVDTLEDAALPALFDAEDSRQLIHITYGFILNHPEFGPALNRLWTEESLCYEALLKQLIGKHMDCLKIPRIG